MTDVIGVAEAARMINPDLPAQAEDVLRRHLAAGKGIAVYRNEDLGHRALGMAVGFTYGTPEAQFEPEQFPDGPPEQCPDGLMSQITGGINWRYRLVAVVEEDQ